LPLDKNYNYSPLGQNKEYSPTLYQMPPFPLFPFPPVVVVAPGVVDIGAAAEEMPKSAS